MQKSSKTLTAFALLVYLFILVPMFIITISAFNAETYITFPPIGLSLRWFVNIFSVTMFIRTFKISMQIAVLSTTLALVVGIPAAYVLSRYRFKGRRILESYFLSPVLIPQIVFGFSLFNFLVITLDLPVFISLFLGHTVFILPYIVRVISSSLSNFNYEIEEAAVSLGASRAYTFFRIVLPNISSGVIAAFVLAFINSFNNVPISVFLTGPGVSTLPIQMMSYVEYFFDPTIAALSVVLMVLTVIIMFIIERTLGIAYFTRNAKSGGQ